MEKSIREFILGLGVDDVGIAAAADYDNPKGDFITKFLPEAKSIIVMAYRVLSNCESDSPGVALNGYMDLAAFARSSSYRVARFLESRFAAKVATMPLSTPMEVRHDRRGIAEFSQRHAAIAAGLGTFGRHNLVLHPEFGTRVNYVSIITDLALTPSPKCREDICSRCDLCVKNCPGGALDEEGKTDLMKCMKNSLPYGIAGDIGFWLEMLQSSPAEQKELFVSERYARLRQSAHLGNQYMCFNCMKSCPVGVKY